MALAMTYWTVCDGCAEQMPIGDDGYAGQRWLTVEPTLDLPDEIPPYVDTTEWADPAHRHFCSLECLARWAQGRTGGRPSIPPVPPVRPGEEE